MKACVSNMCYSWLTFLLTFLVGRVTCFLTFSYIYPPRLNGIKNYPAITVRNMQNQTQKSSKAWKKLKTHGWGWTLGPIISAAEKELVTFFRFLGEICLWFAAAVCLLALFLVCLGGWPIGYFQYELGYCVRNIHNMYATTTLLCVN